MTHTQVVAVSPITKTIVLTWTAHSASSEYTSQAISLEGFTQGALIAPAGGTPSGIELNAKYAYDINGAEFSEVFELLGIAFTPGVLLELPAKAFFASSVVFQTNGASGPPDDGFITVIVLKNTPWQ
jgi:hypothetical protein